MKPNTTPQESSSTAADIPHAAFFRWLEADCTFRDDRQDLLTIRVSASAPVADTALTAPLCPLTQAPAGHRHTRVSAPVR